MQVYIRKFFILLTLIVLGFFVWVAYSGGWSLGSIPQNIVALHNMPWLAAIGGLAALVFTSGSISPTALLSAWQVWSKRRTTTGLCKEVNGCQVYRPPSLIEKPTIENDLISYFQNGGLEPPADTVWRNFLPIRRAVSRLNAVQEPALLYRISGSGFSGKTMLAWQVARFFEKRKFIIIKADADSVDPKSFEQFFSNIAILRWLTKTRYLVVIDDVDDTDRERRAELRHQISHAVQSEKEFRSGRLRKWLRPNTVTFLVVSNNNFEDEHAISSDLEESEEADILDQVAKTALGQSVLHDLELRDVWNRTGGQRSYQRNICGFLENVLIASGKRSLLPRKLFREEYRDAVLFVAPFTILSMPVMPELLSAKQLRAIDSDRKELGRSRIFSDEPRGGFNGIQLRLKPWATIIANTYEGDPTQWLLVRFEYCIRKIVRRDHPSPDEIEWVRHLLHRLFKRRHIGVPDIDGEEIGRRLLQRCASEIERLLEHVDRVEELALWAGTISSIRDENERMINSGIVIALLETIQEKDARAINRHPSGFISLAKAIQALMSRSQSKDVVRRSREVATSIMRQIDFDEVMKRDFELNGQTQDWYLRYSQSVDSFLKITTKLTRYKNVAERANAEIKFIDSRCAKYGIEPSAQLLMRKGKAFLVAGDMKAGFRALFDAVKMARSHQENRESGATYPYALSELCKLHNRYKPEAAEDRFAILKALFMGLSGTSDFVNGRQFSGYYELLFDFAEENPNVFVRQADPDFFAAAAAPCISPSFGEVIEDRYLMVISLGCERRSFPISEITADAVRDAILGIHAQVAPKVRDDATRADLQLKLNKIAWGTGIALQFAASERSSRLRGDTRVSAL